MLPGASVGVVDKGEDKGREGQKMVIDLLGYVFTALQLLWSCGAKHLKSDCICVNKKL